MVEQLPYHLKVKGSSPGATVGTGFRENGEKVIEPCILDTIAAVLSCHRCLINTGVKKMKNN
jgi:hypothetical protein